MNGLTRTPETRTVTDASGMSVVVSEPSEEIRRIIERIVEEHGEGPQASCEPLTTTNGSRWTTL